MTATEQREALRYITALALRLNSASRELGRSLARTEPAWLRTLADNDDLVLQSQLFVGECNRVHTGKAKP